MTTARPTTHLVSRLLPAVMLLILTGTLGAAERPRVRVETSAGEFVIELDDERAPLTVANFLEYAASGHYAGTLFHRVVNGFVIQGGGYDEKLELKPVRPGIANESGNGLINRRGTIAMARLGEPHSADAQFYVNLADNFVLDPKPTRWGYAVFGEVVQGMQVVDEIGDRPTTSRNGMQEVPVEPVVIRRIALIREPATQ